MTCPGRGRPVAIRVRGPAVPVRVLVLPAPRLRRTARRDRGTSRAAHPSVGRSPAPCRARPGRRARCAIGGSARSGDERGTRSCAWSGAGIAVKRATAQGMVSTLASCVSLGSTTGRGAGAIAGGTIVCDLERRRVVDLLPDRSADTLARWLERHPCIRVVARDRAGAYGLWRTPRRPGRGAGGRSVAPARQRLGGRAAAWWSATEEPSPQRRAP